MQGVNNCTLWNGFGAILPFVMIPLWIFLWDVVVRMSLDMIDVNWHQVKAALASVVKHWTPKVDRKQVMWLDRITKPFDVHLFAVLKLLEGQLVLVNFSHQLIRIDAIVYIINVGPRSKFLRYYPLQTMFRELGILHNLSPFLPERHSWGHSQNSADSLPLPPPRITTFATSMDGVFRRF